MVKLSIVITYYKTYELTLKLLDVLIPQLNDEVQVILVDDGCKEIGLDKYKDKIEIIHLEENVGNASALNVGIKKSIGKYIGIIDSDDLITKDYIETLLKAINEHDDDLITMDWQDMNNFVVVHRPSNYAPWRSIYKKDFMPLFVEGMRYSADVPFQDKVYKTKKSEYYLDKVLYFYNSNREGCLTLEKAKYYGGK